MLAPGMIELAIGYRPRRNEPLIDRVWRRRNRFTICGGLSLAVGGAFALVSSRHDPAIASLWSVICRIARALPGFIRYIYKPTLLLDPFYREILLFATYCGLVVLSFHFIQG